MSRESNNQRSQSAASRNRSRGEAPAFDFEAEHDPDRAKRISLMRMRRYEAKQRSGDATAQVQRAATEGGKPLPGDMRAKFEGSTGADLSGVRVHTGEASATAAESVGAKAYTTGQDIHFGAGEYDPSSKQGQHLLAHEVAHTVQQGKTSAGPQAKLEVSSPGDIHEHEADRAADAMVTGAPACVSANGVSSNVQRRPAQSNTAQAAQGGETASNDENHDQKAALVRQAIGFGTFTFTAIRDAVNDAIDLLSVPEVPKTDQAKQLLAFGVSTLLGVASGAAATWFFGQIASAAVAAKAAGTASSLIGGAVKEALSGDHAKAAASLSDIRLAFKETFKVQLNAAERSYVGHWPQLESALGLLSVEQLESFNDIAKGADDASIRSKMKHETFVAWTNFLARVKHGAMGSWDHWAENGSSGAIALPGAQQKPAAGAVDPARSNIAPNSNSPLLESVQRPMQEDAFGVLEIFVDASGGYVVDQPGYRMRLDNVGPKVREEFKTAGKVRDLRVNKVIHLCSNLKNGVRVDPPISIASVMITADGYVRASNWAEYLRVHHEPKKGPVWDPTGFGECSDNIIHGKETADCHIDRKGMAKDIYTFASAAQELPLTYLEV